MLQSLFLSFPICDWQDAYLIEAYLAHVIFSAKHISLFAFRNTRQHLGTMLGGHFEYINYPQNAPKCGNKYTAKKKKKKNTFTIWMLKQGSSIAPCSQTSAGNELVQRFKFFVDLPLASKALGVDWEITNKFKHVGKFENREPTDTGYPLY